MPKRASLTAPLRRPGDTPAMTAAIDWLEAEGLHFIRPSPHQLKIGHLNFYPDRGSIQFDQHRAEAARGLDALKATIGRLKAIDVISLD